MSPLGLGSAESHTSRTLRDKWTLFKPHSCGSLLCQLKPIFFLLREDVWQKKQAKQQQQKSKLNKKLWHQYLGVY